MVTPLVALRVRRLRREQAARVTRLKRAAELEQAEEARVKGQVNAGLSTLVKLAHPMARRGKQRTRRQTTQS